MMIIERLYNEYGARSVSIWMQSGQALSLHRFYITEDFHPDYPKTGNGQFHTQSRTSSLPKLSSEIN